MEECRAAGVVGWQHCCECCTKKGLCVLAPVHSNLNGLLFAVTPAHPLRPPLHLRPFPSQRLHSPSIPLRCNMQASRELCLPPRPSFRLRAKRPARPIPSYSSHNPCPAATQPVFYDVVPAQSSNLPRAPRLAHCRGRPEHRNMVSPGPPRRSGRSMGGLRAPCWIDG